MCVNRECKKTRLAREFASPHLELNRDHAHYKHSITNDEIKKFIFKRQILCPTLDVNCLSL